MKKYKYFEELSTLNKTIFPKSSKNNIRIDEKTIRELDILLENISNKNCDNLDSLLMEVLNVCSVIYSYQPFYDGNARTVKTFLINYLNNKGIKVNIKRIDNLIPIFYPGEKNQVLRDDIKKLKKRIMY